MTDLLYASYAAVLDANRQLPYALARRGLDVTVATANSVQVGSVTHHSEPARGSLHVVPLPVVSRGRTLRLQDLGRLVARVNPKGIFVEADPGSLLVQQVLGVPFQPDGSPIRRVACSSCEVVPRRFAREGLVALMRGRVGHAALLLAGAALEKHHLRRVDTMFCYGVIPAGIFRSVKKFRGTIVETPLGVDTRGFEYAPNESRDPRLSVAYLGRLTRSKSVETLIDACALLTPKPRLMIDELYWEQDPAYRQEIRDRIQRHKFLDADVEYFNPHHSEVSNYLRRADVVALTPRRLGSTIEQYGRAIAEAMAMGKPVIVTRNGHLPYLVGDAGYIVEEGDVDAIAKAIQNLRDERHYMAMSARARARAEGYLSADVQAEHVARWLGSRCGVELKPLQPDV